LGVKQILLKGATLVDGTGEVPLVRTNVLIGGDRIVAVTREDQPTPSAGEAEVHDLRGTFLIPALIDAHAHVYQDWMHSALLSMGITTIRNPMTFPTDDGGTGSEDRLKVDALRAGLPIDYPPSPLPHVATVSTEVQMRDEVGRQAGDGVDLVKLYTGLPPELVRAGVAEAHALGIKAIGDLVRTSWTDAARAGIDYLSHAVPRHPSLLPAAVRAQYHDDVALGRQHPVCRWLELVDLRGEEILQMAEALVECGVAVDPTLTSLEAMLFAGDPRYHALIEDGQRRLPSQLRKQQQVPHLPSGALADLRRRASAAWDKALGLVNLLHEQGVTLLAGTDTPRAWVVPGASLHRELVLLGAAGLSSMEALCAATGQCAAALGIEEQKGTVEPGKRADLVVLDDDPLADINNTTSIRWVMRAGVILTPNGLT
jgi:hypothetical protein